MVWHALYQDAVGWADSFTEVGGTVAVRGAMSDTGGFRRIGQRAWECSSGRLLVVYCACTPLGIDGAWLRVAANNWKDGAEQYRVVVVLLWRIK